jgi:hypothetical protein
MSITWTIKDPFFRAGLMAQNEIAEFFATCDELGEAEVKTRLEMNAWGARAVLATKWLHVQEEKRLAAREDRADRALIAAEKSAKTSEDAAAASKASARAAERSAKWTFWAALIALLTVAVGVLPGFLQWLLS